MRRRRWDGRVVFIMGMKPLNEEKIRAFFAFPAPDRVIQSIEKMQAIITSSESIQWRPISVESLHLTLLFLGEVNEEQLSRISQKAEKICLQTRDFQVSSTHLSWFPSPSGMKPPKVIQLGFECGDALRDLRVRIIESLGSISIKKPRLTFQPHITLGRVRKVLDLSRFKRQVEEMNRLEMGRGHRVEARHLTLFESELKKSGAVYYELAEFPFLAACQTSSRNCMRISFCQ